MKTSILGMGPKLKRSKKGFNGQKERTGRVAGT